MISGATLEDFRFGAPWVTPLFDYWIDASQRSILFLDVLRKRGTNYLEHAGEGQPPVLTFDYEMVMDGRDLPLPVNYALVRIVDRRAALVDRRRSGAPAPDPEAPPRRFVQDRREHPLSRREDPRDPKKRPIVIIDPRAGHGPGIGGMKEDSQVGMALDQGHPVYFVIFYPTPVAGQTVSHVQQAQTAFVRRVAELHPQAQKPAVLGNCQAGWAAALVAADRPELTGPLVLNGSPLSYWAGISGKNPMRYRGGLVGGLWLVSFLGDLGAGRFDGAHLVAAFEDLNPANTYWKKRYHLYANVDTEERRHLEFEKWWTGFFDMTSDEIHFIVRNLFIGNRLETGEIELGDRKIDLRNLTEPVVVFSSAGDNITPPQQALNWILKVWNSVEDVKRQNQKIVYLLHEEIGHLGIFVSGAVANREHREIIGNLCLIDLLPPGLHEMVIERTDTELLPVSDYTVRFEPRDFDDIRALGDGDGGNEDAFRPVAAVSEINDRLYRTFVRPWVRGVTTPLSAEVLRQLHPLRLSRYVFSDWNPLLLPVRFWAHAVRERRRPAPRDNPFLTLERTASEGVVTALDAYRDARDQMLERLFLLTYDNPWVKAFFSQGESSGTAAPQGAAEATTWPDDADVGGFAEAAVRVMAALADARHVIHAAHLETYGRLVERHARLAELPPATFRNILKEQVRILHANPGRALASLGKLVTSPEDRSELVELAQQIVQAHPPALEEETLVLESIRSGFGRPTPKVPHTLLSAPTPRPRKPRAHRDA